MPRDCKNSLDKLGDISWSAAWFGKDYDMPWKDLSLDREIKAKKHKNTIIPLKETGWVLYDEKTNPNPLPATQRFLSANAYRMARANALVLAKHLDQI